MNRKHRGSWSLIAAALSALCLLLAACSSGSPSALLPPTTGGGSQPTGGPPTSRTVPNPSRDPQGYDLQQVPLSSIPNGEVGALGVALTSPPTTASLAALSPGDGVLRVTATASTQETTLGAPGRSLAATATQVFAATRQRGVAGSADVYLREETSPGVFTWRVLLNSGSDVAFVTTTANGVVALFGSSAGTGASLQTYDAPSQTFATTLSLGTLTPSALTSWPAGSADVYVAGTSPGSGSLQLLRVRGSATESFVIPTTGVPQGGREEVTSFAWAADAQGNPLLLLTAGVFDANDNPSGGQVLLFNGTTFTALWAFSTDTPTASAFTAENQIYVGTAQGQLLYYDGSAFVAEPGFPAVSRVTSLLARDAKSLLVGTRTVNGALLVIRTRRSP